MLGILCDPYKKRAFFIEIEEYSVSILNRIRYSTQRGKRKEILNNYGFYITVETQRGILICTNDIFGVGPRRSQYTTFHIHTMLDCMFLIKPHYEDETEYSCKLIKKCNTYNMSLKDVINLLENKYTDSDRFLEFLTSSHYHCKCMEWTQHIYVS